MAWAPPRRCPNVVLPLARLTDQPVYRSPIVPVCTGGGAVSDWGLADAARIFRALRRPNAAVADLTVESNDEPAMPTSTMRIANADEQEIVLIGRAGSRSTAHSYVAGEHGRHRSGAGRKRADPGVDARNTRAANRE